MAGERPTIGAEEQIEEGLEAYDDTRSIDVELDLEAADSVEADVVVLKVIGSDTPTV